MAMRLLVPLDLSDATPKVLGMARRMGLAAHASVWLLHVAGPEPAFVGYAPGPDVVRDQVAEEYRQQHRDVQAHAEELRAAGVDATALLIQGATAGCILAEAERLEADLIVMGTHGRGAVYDLMVGSVSTAVLRGSRIPVLFIPVGKSATADA
jgi:nucleotide-binding universal stress UspA family protein